MDEIWKDIYFWQDGIEYDYRGLYQVSNTGGRVKSLKRTDLRNRTIKEKILKPYKDGSGYFYLTLCKNGEQKRFKVHRLVAHMFLADTYFDGAYIDHIDTNKINNNASNLRWCTSKENSNNPLTLKHKSERMTGENNPMYNVKGENHPSWNTKHTKEAREKMSKGRGYKMVDRFTLDNIYIDTKYQFEYVEMGFNCANMSSCCKWYECGENIKEWYKTHKQKPRTSTGGYIFKYHEEVE